MIFAQIIGLCVLQAAYAAHATDLPYEEDPAHFHEQNVSQLTGMNEQFFVRQRNDGPTNYKCQSAKKKSENPGGTYTYKFSVRNATGHYITWETTVTPLKTGNHTENNAVQYDLTDVGSQVTSKLMTVWPGDGCAVLVTLIDEFRACMLTQTASTVTNATVPASCLDVYNKQCPHLGGDVDVWEPGCH